MKSQSKHINWLTLHLNRNYVLSQISVEPRAASTHLSSIASQQCLRKNKIKTPNHDHSALFFIIEIFLLPLLAASLFRFFCTKFIFDVIALLSARQMRIRQQNSVELGNDRNVDGTSGCFHGIEFIACCSNRTGFLSLLNFLLARRNVSSGIVSQFVYEIRNDFLYNGQPLDRCIPEPVAVRRNKLQFCAHIISNSATNFFYYFLPVEIDWSSLLIETNWIRWRLRCNVRTICVRVA